MKKKKHMHKGASKHKPMSMRALKAMHPHKKKMLFEGAMISLPLAATFAWYSFLIFSSTPIAGAEAKFAPSRIETLVLFLLLFILAYSVFLIFEFRHMKKKWDKVKK